ncbi:MAG: VOC family protein [Myxococcota bacterium]
MSDRHNRIDYIELTVHDLDVAKAFYTGVFGWGFTDYGPGYSGIQGTPREQGGLSVGEVAAPAKGSPLVVLYSDDLDGTLAAVTAQGGAVETPPFDFPGGRRFHFRDPSGNVLAVWTES